MTRKVNFELSGEVELPDSIIEEMIELSGFLQHYWNAGGKANGDRRTFSVKLRSHVDFKGKQTVSTTYDQIMDAFVTLATDKTARPAVRAHLLSLWSGEGGDSDFDAEDCDCIIQKALFGEVIYG